MFAERQSTIMPTSKTAASATYSLSTFPGVGLESAGLSSRFTLSALLPRLGFPPHLTSSNLRFRIWTPLRVRHCSAERWPKIMDYPSHVATPSVTTERTAACNYGCSWELPHKAWRLMQETLGRIVGIRVSKT